jgi:hypothetical protein
MKSQGRVSLEGALQVITKRILDRIPVRPAVSVEAAVLFCNPVSVDTRCTHIPGTGRKLKLGPKNKVIPSTACEMSHNASCY